MLSITELRLRCITMQLKWNRTGNTAERQLLDVFCGLLYCSRGSVVTFVSFHLFTLDFDIRSLFVWISDLFMCMRLTQSSFPHQHTVQRWQEGFFFLHFVMAEESRCRRRPAPSSWLFHVVNNSPTINRRWGREQIAIKVKAHLTEVQCFVAP